MMVEQINTSTGTAPYLHHDQQGSTRLVTGSTGKTEATFAYGPYGTLTGSTGSATTPLGYDGQYTSSDTGLIYMRARTYDPATAQFLSVDPIAPITRTPYAYAEDNPLNFGDPTGCGETQRDQRHLRLRRSRPTRLPDDLWGNTHLACDLTKGLRIILSDETKSYIYGPGGIPVEQINNSTGVVTYLHHDQQGSIRLLTGSTGTITGSTTFDAYGNKTGSTGTSTTPLGYDGQYASSDTGLIYLRARVYDPATAQFLSVDPLADLTRAPYNYAGDNPVNAAERTGLSPWNPFSESFWTEGNVISESSLNPIPYYEQEINSWECQINGGCAWLVYLILPSNAIANAFSAGFHLIAQRALPRPVGSRALVTR